MYAYARRDGCRTRTRRRDCRRHGGSGTRRTVAEPVARPNLSAWFPNGERVRPSAGLSARFPNRRNGAAAGVVFGGIYNPHGIGKSEQTRTRRKRARRWRFRRPKTKTARRYWAMRAKRAHIRGVLCFKPRPRDDYDIIYVHGGDCIK